MTRGKTTNRSRALFLSIVLAIAVSIPNRCLNRAKVPYRPPTQLQLIRLQQRATHPVQPHFIIQPLPVSSQTSAVISLDRVKIRLEGLGPYAVVATLILNGGLRLFSMYREEPDERDKFINSLQLTMLVISIVSAAFTSVVFTMISIHSKAAVGMNKDMAYELYFAATQADRALGFRSLQVALGSFLIGFSLKVKLMILKSRTSAYRNAVDKVIMVSFALVFSFMGYRLFRIGNLAKVLIFS